MSFATMTKNHKTAEPHSAGWLSAATLSSRSTSSSRRVSPAIEGDDTDARLPTRNSNTCPGVPQHTGLVVVVCRTIIGYILTPASARSGGTCDCAFRPRGKPTRPTLLIRLRLLHPRLPCSLRSCPYGLSGIPHRFLGWLRIQSPTYVRTSPPRVTRWEKKKGGVSPAASPIISSSIIRGEHRAVSTSSGSVTAVLSTATLPVPCAAVE